MSFRRGQMISRNACFMLAPVMVERGRMGNRAGVRRELGDRG